MTHSQQVALYNACQPYIFSLARRMAGGATNQFYADLIEAACAEVSLHLCLWKSKGPHGYNPEKGKPETWLRWVIQCAMKSHCRKNRQRSDLHSMEAFDEAAKAARDPVSWLRRVSFDLSEEAWTVLQLVVMAPVELSEDMDCILRANPNSRNTRCLIRRSRTKIRSYLTQHFQWPDTTIDRVWCEVQECL